MKPIKSAQRIAVEQGINPKTYEPWTDEEIAELHHPESAAIGLLQGCTDRSISELSHLAQMVKDDSWTREEIAQKMKALMDYMRRSDEAAKRILNR